MAKTPSIISLMIAQLQKELQKGAENVWQTRMAAPHQDLQSPRDPPQRRQRKPSVAASGDVLLPTAAPRFRRRPSSLSQGLERGPCQLFHVQYHPLPSGASGSSLRGLGFYVLIDLISRRGTGTRASPARWDSAKKRESDQLILPGSLQTTT